MPTEYSELVNLFLDLRGRGMSLSTLDLDILQTWENHGLEIEFIAKVMIEISEECKNKKQIFPTTLQPISRKLNQVLQKMRES